MGKKFDVVIGNPPYQEEAQGEGTRDTPVYHLFMDAAYEVANKAVLITPARFLFNAGFTPKAWNEKMLANRQLSVAHYVANSDDLFPGTDIKGGIAVTYWDEGRDEEPIATFTSYPELNGILDKVNGSQDASITSEISSGRAYAYTDVMHADNPKASSLMSRDAQVRVSTNAFDQLPFLYSAVKPENHHKYCQVLGLVLNRRFTRWIRRDYLRGPDSFDKFKVVLPAANGSGFMGEVLSSPDVIGPEVAVTQSFITIGSFEDEAHARACLKYVKTKFARAMLGVLKITQHNPARVWKHVPVQDFSPHSDIEWSKSIPEIDQQLYAKYDLDDIEIAFIESHVKPMS